MNLATVNDHTHPLHRHLVVILPHDDTPSAYREVKVLGKSWNLGRVYLRPISAAQALRAYAQAQVDVHKTPMGPNLRKVMHIRDSYEHILQDMLKCS